MRNYTPIDLPRINRIDGGDKGRRYCTPEGKLYPSITTVFSVLQNEHLDEWKKRVGESEARKISARAAQRGTFIHEQCEYLLTGRDHRPSPTLKMLYWDTWKNFKPLVDQIGDVLAIEAPLYSDRLRVAGTVDCVGYWNGQLSIIDFKTSGRRKTHGEIDTYWMQCAAYSALLKERTGLTATQLVILMSVDDDDPLVFVDHSKNWLQKFIDVRKVFAETVGD